MHWVMARTARLWIRLKLQRTLWAWNISFHQFPERIVKVCVFHKHLSRDIGNRVNIFAVCPHTLFCLVARNWNKAELQKKCWNTIKVTWRKLNAALCLQISVERWYSEWNNLQVTLTCTTLAFLIPNQK